jgi:hypothetical protein
MQKCLITVGQWNLLDAYSLNKIRWECPNGLLENCTQ